MRRSCSLAVMAAILLVTAPAEAKPPPKAHAAWDATAEVVPDCLLTTITIKNPNPSSGDYGAIVGRNGVYTKYQPFLYTPSDLTESLPTGVAQNGSTTTVSVLVYDHDSLGLAYPRERDIIASVVRQVGPCGSPPPALPVPPAPPAPPGPPSPPACHPRLVRASIVTDVPAPPPPRTLGSLRAITIRQGGSTLYVADGRRLYHIRWRSQGRLVGKGHEVTFRGRGKRLNVFARVGCRGGH